MTVELLSASADPTTSSGQFRWLSAGSVWPRGSASSALGHVSTSSWSHVDWLERLQAVFFFCPEAAMPEPLLPRRADFAQELREVYRGAVAEWRIQPPGGTSTGPSDPAVCVWPHLEKLGSFAKLEHNWDSYGAVPIAREAIRCAQRLVLLVAEGLGVVAGVGGSPYAVAPVPDGGVYVEWRGPGGELQVWVDDCGRLSYLLVTGTGDCPATHEQDAASLEDVVQVLAGLLVPWRPA